MHVMLCSQGLAASFEPHGHIGAGMIRSFLDLTDWPVAGPSSTTNRYLGTLLDCHDAHTLSDAPFLVDVISFTTPS